MHFAKPHEKRRTWKTALDNSSVISSCSSRRSCCEVTDVVNAALVDLAMHVHGANRSVVDKQRTGLARKNIMRP